MYTFSAIPNWVFMGSIGLTVFVILAIGLTVIALFEEKLGEQGSISLGVLIAAPFFFGGLLLPFEVFEQDITTDNPATVQEMLDKDSKGDILSEFSVDADALQKVIAEETGTTEVNIDIENSSSNERSFTIRAADGTLIPFTAVSGNAAIIGNFYYDEESMVIVFNTEAKNVEEIVVPMN